MQPQIKIDYDELADVLSIFYSNTHSLSATDHGMLITWTDEFDEIVEVQIINAKKYWSENWSSLKKYNYGITEDLLEVIDYSLIRIKLGIFKNG